MINFRAALVLIAFAALSPDAFAQPGRWVRMESEHFVVTSDASEIATQETLVNLEAFDRLMRNRLGVRRT